MVKKYLVVHPLLFATFPILFIFTHNIDQVYFRDTLLGLSISILFAIVMQLILSLILGNRHKSGIITTIFLIIFFSYGHIFELTRWVLGKDRYLLIIFGILFLLLVYNIIRSKNNLTNLTKIINIMGLILIIFPLFNIVMYELKTNKKEFKRNYIENSNAINTIKEKNEKLFDIYYIILDGYASTSTLKTYYNYNNSEFIDYLTDKGFFIASKSISNYSLTFLSLASTLNLEYINYLSDIIGRESKNRKILYSKIENNQVIRFLKSRGYAFIHFGSGWKGTSKNRYAQRDYNLGYVDEFFMILAHTTLMLPFKKNFGLFQNSRKRILETFEEIAEIPKDRRPTFTFAHILIPHPPYLFGKDGEPIPKSKLMLNVYQWKDKGSYANQLIFVNKKVRELVNKLLLRSESPPIIILQADHGPASSFKEWHTNGNKADLNPFPTDKMLMERMRILNAYYLPDNDTMTIYNSITPVNTFRLIFNFYFNTEYEILKDRSYYSIYSKPYDFRDVTNNVRYVPAK